MRKLIFAPFSLTFLGLLFPSLIHAASNSSLSFTPPPGDFSVVFLGNIFGIVDGVLHGTGSQIMGTMFGVFNSAVLALGGIIIMYTLLVSTMNTAHEGELLGRKWSSIWVPLRSTLGLALLVPKASGYCLMQIFVMWIVIQGVGAADKIWTAALTYLNRGGTIIQAQLSPANKLLDAGGEAEIVNGAAKILAAQVCMYGLETLLSSERQLYLAKKNKNQQACSGSPSPDMKGFCETPVPDFLSSVNATITPSPIKMPNFSDKSPYYFLNGICGTLKWKRFTEAYSISNDVLNKSDRDITSRARDAAVQQLYNNLALIAQRMVGNSPVLNANNQKIADKFPHPVAAMQQFGIPIDENGFCLTKDTCIGWGGESQFTGSPLFQGTEFQSAISVYNATMRQSLALLQRDKTKDEAKNSREFIKLANQQGWLMAGSYFFKLVQLNAINTTPKDAIDSNSGLAATEYPAGTITSAFQGNQCKGTYSRLCIWLSEKVNEVKAIDTLIDGSNTTKISTKAEIPKSSDLPGFNIYKSYSGDIASTAIGFLNNSMMVKLPDQPGQEPPKFIFKLNIDFSPDVTPLGPMDFECDSGFFGWFKCIGAKIVEAIYNYLIRHFINIIIGAVTVAIQTLISVVLILPLKALTIVFQNGVEQIQQPNVNPVVALAAMGVYYINVAIKIWVLSTMTSVAIILLPWAGLVVMPIMALATPIFFSWVGIMASVGFLTAYYIPFVPYMIFTFGTIAWLMAVIEAMVAAPIVALGVTHPEGEGAFGKGEQAIMILFNVFLRPSMMIIGYIAAIALTYVSVWIINAGFSNVLIFLQGTSESSVSFTFNTSKDKIDTTRGSYLIDQKKGYIGWAGAFGYFFSVLIYTSMYLTVVQRAFTLITSLPDKILRWISGGASEQVGAEAAGWAEESKQQVSKAGDTQQQGQAQAEGKLSGMAMDKAKEYERDKKGAGNVQTTPNAKKDEGGNP